MTTREGAAASLIDRLNAETRAWSFEIANHHILEDEVVVLGRLVVDGVSKMAFAAAPIAHGQRTGAVSTALTSAANEALLRTARLFGVGLVLQPTPEVPARLATDFEGSEGRATEAVTPENRITQKQLGAINGIARRRNLGRAEFAHMLDERFGRTELALLTKREASDLLSQLSESNGHANT